MKRSRIRRAPAALVVVLGVVLAGCGDEEEPDIPELDEPRPELTTNDDELTPSESAETEPPPVLDGENTGPADFRLEAEAIVAVYNDSIRASKQGDVETYCSHQSADSLEAWEPVGGCADLDPELLKESSKGAKPIRYENVYIVNLGEARLTGDDLHYRGSPVFEDGEWKL